MVTQILALASVVGGGALAGLIAARALMPPTRLAPVTVSREAEPPRLLDALLAPYEAHA